MQKIFALIFIALPLLALLIYVSQTGEEPGGGVSENAPGSVANEPDSPSMKVFPDIALPKRAVLDISVHTIDELKVLLDRAEGLAMAPQPPGAAASVILVLHGPEIEFFATGNYDKYKDIVDQAARLDAFDVVDVKICQAMMEIKGIPRDDIPPFIEQVPLGPAEIDRLVDDVAIFISSFVAFQPGESIIATEIHGKVKTPLNGHGIHGRTRKNKTTIPLMATESTEEHER